MTIWVPSPGPTGKKDRVDSWKLSHDLHMCVVACEYPYTYKDRNKYMNMETHLALQFQRNRQASESSVERPRDRN